MIEVTPYAGEHIATFAKKLVRAAAEHGAAKGTFNAVKVTADRSATEDSICADWQRQWDAKCAAYRNSDDGKAAAAKREAQISARQEQHDALMHDLATLDFSRDVAVLDWLCAFQDCADDVSVVKNATAVLSAFTAAGFTPNVNCGADYNGDDRDNAFRYLVGQALAGIERVGAPHGIVIQFAADWKTKLPMCDLCNGTRQFTGRVDHHRWMNTSTCTSATCSVRQEYHWEGSHIPCPRCRPEMYGIVTSVTKRKD